MAVTVLTRKDIEPILEEFYQMKKELETVKSELAHLKGRPKHKRVSMQEAQKILSVALCRPPNRLISARQVSRYIDAGIITSAQKLGDHRNAPLTFLAEEIEQLAREPEKLTSYK